MNLDKLQSALIGAATALVMVLALFGCKPNYPFYTLPADEARFAPLVWEDKERGNVCYIFTYFVTGVSCVHSLENEK